jgi:outer membrane protein
MSILSRIRFRNLLVAPICLIALATGCTVNQQKEVSHYREVLDGKNPPPVSEEFDGKPLSLEEALLLANRRNETLALQGELYVQALIAKQRAFAAFLPTITLAPTISYTQKPASNTAYVQKPFITDVPVVGSGNLFNGFQDAAALTGAGFTVEQRKWQLLDMQQTIFLDVAQTYYSVLSNERSVLVLTNSVLVQHANVENMQAQQRVGVARPLDVAQAEAQEASTRAQLVGAQQNVQNARIMLAYLIDAPVDKAVLVDRLDVPNPLISEAQALATARVSRQDLISTREGVESARQAVTSALGQYYPSVSLQLDYFLHKESIPTLSEWTGLLDVSLPLFDSGIIYANVRQAWSNLRSARLTELSTLRQADQQVRTGIENVVASEATVKELITEVAAAHDAYYQAQQSYNAGLATYLDELTALNQLLTAQLSLASEEFSYKVYYLDLLRAMGVLLRPEHIVPATMPSSQPSGIEVTTPTPNKAAQNQEISPGGGPSNEPTTQPGAEPTTQPSPEPGAQPSAQPETQPTGEPNPQRTTQP